MSDLIKFQSEKRSFEVDLSRSFSTGDSVFRVQSVEADSPAIMIGDVDSTPSSAKFTVLPGGRQYREYEVTIRFRTSNGDDLESRVTLLIR